MTIDLLKAEPPADSAPKKLATLPAEADVAITDIELDPLALPLEAERRAALVKACVAALEGGEFAPTVDLMPCVPRNSSAPSYVCPADLAWVVAQAKLGAKKVRARLWPEDARDALECRLWRERADPSPWGAWDQAVYIQTLLTSRGETVDDEQSPSKKSIAKNLRKTPSTVTELAQLSTVNPHFLRLLEMDKLRGDDGARIKAALQTSEHDVVQRAVSLAALQGRGAEITIETAVSTVTGRLSRKTAPKPMVLPPHDGPLERAGSVLACVADALAEDVAIAIRPANLSPDVSVEPPGWVRDAGPQHALIRFAAAPTQRQLQRVEQLLRDEGLL